MVALDMELEMLRVSASCSLVLDMVVCNTLFNKRSSRLITYSSGGVNTQIDYMLMKTRDKKILKGVKVIPGEEVFTQHKLAVCLNIRIEREKKKPYIPKLKVWKLREAEAKKEFVSCVEEQCLACDQTDDVEGNWRKLKKILLDSIEKVCGRTKGPALRKSTWWWDGKVEKVIKEKRRLWKEWKNGSCSKERYIEAKQVARRQVYEVKSKAVTEQFGNLSTSKNCWENAFRIAKHIANANKGVIGDTCVKNDNGCLVFTDTEKLKAWKEHYEKLLNEEFPWDSNLLQMENPKEGPAPWLEKDAIYTAPRQVVTWALRKVGLEE